MALISVANLKILTDKLAYLYDDWRTLIGVHSGSSVAGTSRKLMDNLLDFIVSDLNDYQQQSDMAAQVYAQGLKTNRKDIAKAILQTVLGAIQDHMGLRGSSVSATITDLSTYLTYYNGTGDVAYSSMLHPVFGDLWYDVYAARLPAAGLFHPGIHPSLDSTYTNGFGTRAVGGSYTDGSAYESTPLYSALTPLLEITTSFADGGAAPVIAVAGTDDTGATSTTWDVTLGSNNPTASVSTTTSEAITAMTRDTITLGSGTGIIAGSVLTINSGEDDEEVIVVESISTDDITAVFKKAHASGAAVTGKTTVALTPSVAGRRLRNASNITITISSHSAGTVRVVGKQERGYRP